MVKPILGGEAMARRSKGLAELSAAEWEVMKVMWERGPLASRDIYAAVSGEREWAYSTVKTLVRRMVGKGWLTYEQVGNSYLYRAAVGRRKAVRGAVREFTSRVLDGVLSPFVAYYAEERELSAEDARRLEEILAEHRKKKGK